MTTLVAVWAQTTRAAWKASIRGIWTPNSSTSGPCARAAATASSPSAASATTEMSGWSSRIMLKPPRTSSWSSATTTRMLRSRSSSSGGQSYRNLEPPGAGPGPEPGRATAGRGPLPDAEQPVPAAGQPARGRGGRAVVQDRDQELGLPPVQRDRGRVGVGVLDDVGQRLLDDPVGRQLHLRRQPAARPPGHQRHVRAHRSYDVSVYQSALTGGPERSWAAWSPAVSGSGRRVLQA